MHWTTVAAIGLAAAINAAVLRPAWARYTAWRDSPRARVARRNWRGVYVPDLTLIRVRRAFWSAVALVFLLGFVSLLFVIPQPHR